MVVRVVGGGWALRRCLSRLAPQAAALEAEVIVPHDSSVAGIADLRAEFPWLTFLNIGTLSTDTRAIALGAEHERYDRRTSAGLAVATGDIVALLEDYGAPSPDWCQQVLRAHERPHAAIGGAVEHAGRGALNWAVYLLDFGRYQLPVPDGASSYLTDVNVSYKRAALEEVRHLWLERYNEVSVHWALARRGLTLWLTPQVVVCEDRGPLSLRGLLLERMAWGRLFGATRAGAISPLRRVVLIGASPLLPMLLVGRTVMRVFARRRHRLHCLLALPQVAMLATAWALGEALGYVTGQEFR